MRHGDAGDAVLVRRHGCDHRTRLAHLRQPLGTHFRARGQLWRGILDTENVEEGWADFLMTVSLADAGQVAHRGRHEVHWGRGCSRSGI